MFYNKLNIYGFIVIMLIILRKGQAEWSIANLDEKCMFCLCEAATGCDMERRCNGGICGPFKISKNYWLDADNVTMYADDYRRSGAYEACANDYYCARRIVKNYLAKFGRDCNGDGVTDCFDYMMINFNGGYNCKKSLKEDKKAGVDWLLRYSGCMKN